MELAFQKSWPSLLLTIGGLFLLFSSFIKSTRAMNIPESVLNDPRFINCMGEVGGPEDPEFVNIFTKCYSMAGRPRFGKRLTIGSRQRRVPYKLSSEYEYPTSDPYPYIYSKY